MSYVLWDVCIVDFDYDPFFLEITLNLLLIKTTFLMYTFVSIYNYFETLIGYRMFKLVIPINVKKDKDVQTLESQK